MNPDEYTDDRDLEQFWSEVTPRREPMNRRWFLPAVAAISALSIPWYLPAGSIGRMVGGLPVWIWTALAATASIAALTAWMALREWDDDQD